jgi:DNA-binding MarR family transcriptional regulator
MPKPTLDEFMEVAEFRAMLQHFLRESERVTARHGLTSQRYLLLLMVKGARNGSERATVGELSDRLQLAQHTVSELVGRAVKAGLIRREVATEDRRFVHLSLTPSGERRLARSFSDLAGQRAALRALVELMKG